MAQVAFRVEGALVLVSALSVGLEEVDLFLCASSLSEDSSMCHFGKQGSSPFDLHKPMSGVVISQLSSFYAEEIQEPGSSLLGLLHEVFSSGVAFPLSRPAKTLRWPFWPYSREGASLSVPAVPDLLALP